MYRMMGTKFMQDKRQIEKVKAGIKASMAILPLLGITWLFGLLGFSLDTIEFKYIFAVFNSLQGLMIFIFHCALNKEVRKDCVLFLFCFVFVLFCFCFCFCFFCKLGLAPLLIKARWNYQIGV